MRDADRLARALGARRASRRGWRQTLRRGPIAQAAPASSRRERRISASRRWHRPPCAPQDRSREMPCLGGWWRRLTPMPTDDASTARPAPRLRSGCRRPCRRPHSTSFGHLSDKPRCQTPAPPRRWRRAPRGRRRSRALRRPLGGRRIGQQQARVEIAGLATPTSGRGGRGRRSGCAPTIQSGPRSPARASAQRFGVGRAERFVGMCRTPARSVASRCICWRASARNRVRFSDRASE